MVCVARLGERGLGAVALVLVIRGVGGLGTVIHEGVELFLVLRGAEPLEEALEGLLLVFETAQGFGLVAVKGGVARGAESVATVHPVGFMVV